MAQFSGYIGNTPVPKGTHIITHGTIPLATNYITIPGGYSVGAVRLFIDGIRINESDYIADNGTTIEFGSTMPPGTQYVVEELDQFKIPNMDFLEQVSIVDPKRYNIRYTSDLWSNSHINKNKIEINDVFVSKFYDGTKQMGSGGEWHVVSLVSTPPEGVEGLNNDGCVYSLREGNYIQFSMVSTLCSPIKYGRGESTVRNLYRVCGGYHCQPLILGGFWTIGDGGGGHFMWNKNKDKASHDGGTIIDPNKVNELGDGDVPLSYLNSNPTGKGCWVRINQEGLNPKWFGDFS